MSAHHKRVDATPTPIVAEDSEPVAGAVEPSLKKASDIAGWLKTLGALGIGMFVAGGATYTLAARVATKADLTAAKSELAAQLSAHTASPHAPLDGGPAITKRIDGIEARVRDGEARDAVNQWWIRESISALMRDRGLRPPPAAPTEPPTIRAPR